MYFSYPHAPSETEASPALSSLAAAAAVDEGAAAAANNVDAAAAVVAAAAPVEVDPDLLCGRAHGAGLNVFGQEQSVSGTATKLDLKWGLIGLIGFVLYHDSNDSNH